QHGVTSRWTTRDPASCPQRARGEERAVGRLMREGDAIQLPDEHHVVLTHQTTATESVEADLPGRPGAGATGAAVATNRRQLDLPSACDRLAQRQGRAA